MDSYEESWIQTLDFSTLDKENLCHFLAKLSSIRQTNYLVRPRKKKPCTKDKETDPQIIAISRIWKNNHEPHKAVTKVP